MSRPKGYRKPFKPEEDEWISRCVARWNARGQSLFWCYVELERRVSTGKSES